MKATWKKRAHTLELAGPCPRCYGHHDGIEIKKLTNPLTALDHWAICPKTKEPFLMEVTKVKLLNRLVPK